MKNFTAFIASIALLISISACSQGGKVYSSFWGGKRIVASNNLVTKDIKISNFTKVRVTGSPDVTYTQKPGHANVEVYTSDNIVDLLDIKVENSTLYIGFKKNINVSYKKLAIRISSESLNGISVTGSGDIYMEKGLKSNDDLSVNITGSGDFYGKDIECSKLDISVAGSGDVKANNITCQELKSSVSGSGDISLKDITTIQVETRVSGSGSATLTGTAQDASYSVAGSGDLFASDFKVKTISASVSGSGDIKCYATDFLKARTSGSGSIGYKGEPKLDYPKKNLYKL